MALLGWSLNAVEAAAKFDRRYVVVAPDWAEEYCTRHEIPYLAWNFERINDRSMEIAEKLHTMGVDVAIPLCEETVEWAGAINSVVMNNPRLLGQAMLMRDKSLMKRRAQLGGIRVGIFEEAHDREDVIRFLRRVNQTLLKLAGDPNDPIHFKAFDPKTTEDEIEAFFPREVVDAKGYAGCFGVYPRLRVVSQLQIPEETENHPYFESHELTAPMEETVTKRTAFGTHWGLVYFAGEDPEQLHQPLKRQEELDYYV